jgi:ribosomal protein S18 acetylase RimI-like enzyme
VIEYAHSEAGINPEQLRGFFAGWPDPPSPERHLELLRGSDHVVLTRDGERVVGFATAISDGVLSAYIPLLEVLAEHQGRGIGTEALGRAMGARNRQALRR